RVTISAAATGYTGGTDTLDVTDDEPTPVIIDDGDANFSHTGFEHLDNPSLPGYDTDWHRLQAGGTGEARWIFNNLTDGQYLVSATWREMSNRANDAPFIIEDSSGAYIGAVAVNQQLAPDDRTDAGSAWKDLDTVSVTGGTIAVKLNQSLGASGPVFDDAVRIVRVGDLAGSSLSGSSLSGSSPAGSSMSGSSADAAFASEELLDDAFDELAEDWQAVLSDDEDPFGEF
ncbi:MAG: hypothetical protein QF408_13370, partial [Pirellulales bacterium]|nr:hypothetical protein [Pirellulales bacterium]